MKSIFFILPLFAVFAFCNNRNTTSSKEMETFQFHGLLNQQGITTYQYGTHVISNGNQTYALKSSTVNLDPYIGKSVTIKGKKIEGYPVENGPDFIEVSAVQ